MEIRLKIENGPSKEEEKTILFKLWDAYRVAAPDSYLVNLFSQEFIGWCKNQISNDFTCNAYEYIEAGTESINMKTDLEEAQARVVDLDQSLRSLEKDYEDLKKEKENLYNRIEELSDQGKEKNQIISDLEEERNSLQDENFKFQELNEQLELTVMGLKADLYDLMKKN